MDFEIGKIGASVILSIILRLIYNTWELSNRVKPWVAVGCGFALGLVALFYTGQTCTFKAVTDYLISGLMVGATAVGFYEMTKRSGQ